MAAAYNDTLVGRQNLEIDRTVRQERDRLLRFIRARVLNEDDAQDILQDVFWQLIEAYRGLETIERVTSWLFQVARNKIVDRYRRKKREAPLRPAAEHEERASTNLEDIQQETWLRVFQSMESFRWQGEESFVHWLETIAENVIRSLARREQRKPLRLMSDSALDAAQAPADDSPGGQVRKKERFHRLQQALQTLDPDSRRVVFLSRIEGLPIKEVAKRMARTPNATSILLYRAFVKLRSSFGDTESLSLPFRTLEDPETNE